MEFHQSFHTDKNSSDDKTPLTDLKEYIQRANPYVQSDDQITNLPIPQTQPIANSQFHDLFTFDFDDNSEKSAEKIVENSEKNENENDLQSESDELTNKKNVEIPISESKSPSAVDSIGDDEEKKNTKHPGVIIIRQYCTNDKANDSVQSTFIPATNSAFTPINHDEDHNHLMNLQAIGEKDVDSIPDSPNVTEPLASHSQVKDNLCTSPVHLSDEVHRRANITLNPRYKLNLNKKSTSLQQTNNDNKSPTDFGIKPTPTRVKPMAMGDFADHVAIIARLGNPSSPVSPLLRKSEAAKHPSLSKLMKDCP